VSMFLHITIFNNFNGFFLCVLLLMYSHLNVKTLGMILGSLWPNKQLDIYGLLMGSLLNVSNSMNNFAIRFLCFSEKMTSHLFWTIPSA